MAWMADEGLIIQYDEDYIEELKNSI